ncbi:alpha-ketoglutarate-dependent dioxygenase alkB homolog 3 isoform X1 [Rhineura floridana]|uniref:alpha-ketoglutarate-dependent dioxygenase alkB homolog 3 isoform X1 n=1 Tax=Rhineura floridana TaxID=261503 RepID=UPI002AC81E8A|nr:alpha-ketoglutarate-dependent dioxygenase alkB homolog 3 isoform X1 [Rhineura floridana]XP_061466799.1 alpha-ketoglutarate-dependent dioxygenase alkB homolog 3 isoform X1 [Rhineura floridana]XP_061466800.1 alpha-ketoglutarate-dependent dioxygenase alkB homolog 3 isoform X1 [Rhineura floridana]
MENKRQRARVQGGWAGPVNNRAASCAASGVSGARNQPSASAAQSWVRREEKFPSERQFVFKAPEEVVRKAPEPKRIEKQGVYEISTLPSGISRIHLIPGFIDLNEADWMFEQLLQEIPWRQRAHIRQDLSYDEPRLTAWYGELPYTYSRLTMKANPDWHPLLTMLKDRIEDFTKHSFNSLLCNLYRNEKDSVDWHSDDEPALGRNPVIASLSFGATRMFEMRKKPLPYRFTESCLVPTLTISNSPGLQADVFSSPSWRCHSLSLGSLPCQEENNDYTYGQIVHIPVDHGTLLMMEGATQEDWQHRIPKDYHSREARVNLTFRTMYSDSEAMRA